MLALSDEAALCKETAKGQCKMSHISGTQGYDVKSVKIQRQASSALVFLFWLCPGLSMIARSKVSAVEFTIYPVSKTEDCLFCHLVKLCKTLQTLIAGISHHRCRWRPFPYCCYSMSWKHVWRDIATAKVGQLNLLRSCRDLGWEMGKLKLRSNEIKVISGGRRKKK